jgi:Arm DNA-binding domain
VITAKNFRQLLAQPGRYRDTAGEARGLMLVVTSSTAASWKLRYELNGQERYMGLGPARLVGLAEARAKARDLGRPRPPGR